MAIVKPSLALQFQRDAIRNTVSRFGLENPRIFGSVVHGLDDGGSDLDLLVNPLPGATLFDLGGLQFEREELLGMPVNLLTPDDLPEKFQEQVLAKAHPI